MRAAIAGDEGFEMFKRPVLEYIGIACLGGSKLMGVA
jgi:hypothetical protein